MGDMVIVAYKPKSGCDDALLDLVRKHVLLLQSLGLATDRPAYAMKNGDGVIIEVFEWKTGATEKAHSHPDVQRLWEKFAAVCDYTPLKELPEAANMFAEFTPIDL